MVATLELSESTVIAEESKRRGERKACYPYGSPPDFLEPAISERRFRAGGVNSVLSLYN